MKQKIKELEHRLNCNAAICNEDCNLNFKCDVVWYPGEPVCKQAPFQEFQKKQLEINKLVVLGKFKNMEYRFTAEMLERMLI